MKQSPANRNVFQIYLDNDKKLPFIVRNWNWKRTTFQITEIYTDLKITIDRDGVQKGPYGKAYGYPFFDGVKTSEEPLLLERAGCYQWELVDG
jgi:hypothetical protein